jgi:Ca2+-binding EF-hand superfamily protein
MTTTCGKDDAVELLRRDVKEVFHLVELQTKDKRGKCDEREFPTIFRALGVNPTQGQLRDIISDLRDDIEEPSGYVNYERFSRTTMQALTERVDNFTRDHVERISRAFHVFDPDRKGYIDGELLKELLTTRGEPFDEEEAQEALTFASEKMTGRVYYEEFAEILANDGRVTFEGI